MEDSPLSIAANIAGILTFAAAILAAAYIRYTTLSNGLLEMATVRSSVEANLQDLRMIGLRSRLTIKESDDSDTAWLKKLIVSIYSVEIVTSVYVKRAAGLDTSSMLLRLPDCPIVGVTPTTWNDALREAKEVSMEIGSIHDEIEAKSISKRPNYLASALQATLRLGSTPQLVRWYRVRDRVFEKIRQREHLRSRLLFHQMSMANSAASRNNNTLQQLLKQQAEFNLQLEELTRLVTATNQDSSQPKSVGESRSPAETQKQVSPGQQEDVERHVGAEGSEFETTDCFE